MSLTDALRDADGNVVVPAHELAAVVQLLEEGHITETAAFAAARVPDHAEADVRTARDNAAGRAQPQRLVYYKRLEAAAILLQSGAITAAEFDTIMELA